VRRGGRCGQRRHRLIDHRWIAVLLEPVGRRTDGKPGDDASGELERPVQRGIVQRGVIQRGILRGIVIRRLIVAGGLLIELVTG
jgi:hypothetical protein